MNLISTLNAGIVAAANGWAEVYIRGTSTRATVYYDFEASTSDSSGDNIDLDAYGAVEVYVNQLVDIVAKSPDGTVIRSWTDGYSSPNVEVISPAFTGNDYVSGAAAVNEPTTLQAVLNLWSTNAGAPDWKVLIGGANTTLLNAFGSLTGLVFNVKNPAYGAVGDGVTNDQAAIQAALAAAVAAGGGVVFVPRGTYVISTAMEWDHRVSLVGVGGALSVITTNSAANARILTLTAGAALNSPVLISGIGFASTQANTGEQIYGTVAVNLSLHRCLFGASATATGIQVRLTANGNSLAATECRFIVNSGTNPAASWASTALNPTSAKFSLCTFVTSQTAYAGSLLLVAGKTSVVGCSFSITSVTGASTKYAIECLSSDDRLMATGCGFQTLAQTFTSFFKFNAGALVSAFGNEVDPNFSAMYTTGGLANGSTLQLHGTRTIAASTTPTVPDGCAYALMTSGLAAPTWTMPTGFYPGQELTILMENTSGGAWSTIAFTGATTTTTGIPTINNGASGAVNFVWSDLTTPGTYVWRSIWTEP